MTRVLLLREDMGMGLQFQEPVAILMVAVPPLMEAIVML